MKTITNSKMRAYVDSKIPFNASNCYGRQVKDIYVVYSYGPHFPMYLYDSKAGYWIGTSSTYSRTTARHKSLARPSEALKAEYEVSVLYQIITDGGISNTLAKQLIN